MTTLMIAWLAFNFVLVPLIGMRVYAVRNLPDCRQTALYRVQSAGNFSQLGGQP